MFFIPRKVPEEGLTLNDAKAILGTPALGSMVRHMEMCSKINKSEAVKVGLELVTEISKDITNIIEPNSYKDRNDFDNTNSAEDEKDTEAAEESSHTTSFTS